MDICDTCQTKFEKQHALQDTSPYDIQHGIAYLNGRLWPFEQKRSDPKSGAVNLYYHFLDPDPSDADKKRELELKKNTVITTIEAQRKPADTKFATWEDHANIKFHQTEDVTKSDIRITFEHDPAKKACWSDIGITAETTKAAHKATMSLSGIHTQMRLSNPDVGSKLDRRNILHEFGHALGLEHEHESPAGGVKNPLKFEDTHFTGFDEDSIMIYRKYTLANGQEIEKPRRPTKLSKTDKAFITLLYPPDIKLGIEGSEERKTQLDKAMNDVGLGDKVKEIYGVFSKHPHKDVWKRLSGLRSRLIGLNNDQKNAYKANGIFLHSLNPSALNQSYLTDYVHGAAENKLLQALIRNIVTKAFVRNGIEIAEPQPKISSRDIMEMIGALAIQEDVINQVKHYNTLFYGRSTPQDGSSSDEDGDDSMAPNNPSLAKSSRAHIKKPARSGDVTIAIEDLERNVEIHDEATDTREQSIDIKGTLHFSEEHDLEHAINVHWTPENIVFFRNDLSIIARFVPDEKENLGNGTKTFKGVKWPSANGI